MKGKELKIFKINTVLNVKSTPLDLSSYILGMNNWPVSCNVALTFESLDKIIWHENFGISLTWCYLFFSILENLIWQNH